MFGGSSAVFLGDMYMLETSESTGWTVVPGGGSSGPNAGGNATVPSARSYAATWTRRGRRRMTDRFVNATGGGQVAEEAGGGEELWMWGGFGCREEGDATGHLLADMWSWSVDAPSLSSSSPSSSSPTKTGSWQRRSQGGGPFPSPRNWANFWSTNDGNTLWLHSGMGGPITPWGGFAEPFSDLWRFDVDTETTGGSGGGKWTNVYDFTKFDPGVQYDGPPQNRSPGYRSNAYTATRRGAAAAAAAAGAAGGTVTGAAGGAATAGTAAPSAAAALSAAAAAAASSAAPTGDELWLYGGEGGITNHHPFNSTVVTEGDFQDVWKFDTASSLWSHVAGPRTVHGHPSYGTKGVGSATNLPPAEHAGVIFRHLSTSEQMYYFGGENGSETSGMRNGLWSFDVNATQWAWVSGAKGYNGSATYGERHVAGAANTPGARYAGQGWVVAEAGGGGNAGEGGKLWLFGGYGLDVDGNAGYLADTWSYDLNG
jgi:hypothetical protein